MTGTEVTAFIFDQDTPRTANHCDHRTALQDVEIRADLTLFPRLDQRVFKPLDADLGCLRPGRPSPPAPQYEKGGLVIVTSSRSRWSG